MVIQDRLPSGAVIRARVIVVENAGAICMKMDTAGHLCVNVPFGAPDSAAQQFLKAWMPETWPAAHASPGSRRGREQRREDRDRDRAALEACLTGLMPALEAEMGLKGIAWDTCCQGKAWARFRYDENRISFHPALGLQEMDVIREVALHELLHTRYREHVPAFWQELTHLEPEWPCLEGRLRNGKLS